MAAAESAATAKNEDGDGIDNVSFSAWAQKPGGKSGANGSVWAKISVSPEYWASSGADIHPCRKRRRRQLKRRENNWRRSGSMGSESAAGGDMAPCIMAL